MLRSRLLPSRLFCAALLTMAVAGPAAAQPARPVQLQRVVDGDTVVVAGGGPAGTALRLQGIDAPESCQPWGVQAREALDEHLRGRALTLRTQGRDSDGRLLATLFADGDEVNAWMVVEGHAWSQRVKWDRGPYVKQERVAAALARGLHSLPGATKPWDFRAMRGGPCNDAPSQSAGAPTTIVPAGNPRPPR
jgi:endonuclease YncB( thermonuclease family)